jgi:hypothetical protein
MAAAIVQGVNPNSCNISSNDFSASNPPPSDSSDQVIECYCSNLTIQNILNSSSLQSLCSSYLVSSSLRHLLLYLSAIVIIIVNLILRLLLKKSVVFSRYPSVGKQTSAGVIKIFFAMFINTAIVPMIMHADIFGFIPTVSFSNIVPPLHDLLQQQ